MCPVFGVTEKPCGECFEALCPGQSQVSGGGWSTSDRGSDPRSDEGCRCSPPPPSALVKGHENNSNLHAAAGSLFLSFVLLLDRCERLIKHRELISNPDSLLYLLTSNTGARAHTANERTLWQLCCTCSYSSGSRD